MQAAGAVNLGVNMWVSQQFHVLLCCDVYARKRTRRDTLWAGLWNRWAPATTNSLLVRCQHYCTFTSVGPEDPLNMAAKWMPCASTTSGAPCPPFPPVQGCALLETECRCWAASPQQHQRAPNGSPPPPPLYKLRLCPSYSRRRDRINLGPNFNLVPNVVQPHKTWVW